MPTALGSSEDSDHHLRPTQLEQPDLRSTPASIAVGINVIALIEPRTLARETLAAALATAAGDYQWRCCANFEDWRTDTDCAAVAALVVCLDGFADGIGAVEDEIRQLHDRDPAIPVVVIAGSEDPIHIVRVLGIGARGYIPTSANLDVAVQAVSLAITGGTFVPAVALFNAVEGGAPASNRLGWQFGLTERQAAVAEAVAQGKPNKLIAFELGLCENTVKVHIRTLIKKLHARNRTEIAFKVHAAKKSSDSSR